MSLRILVPVLGLMLTLFSNLRAAPASPQWIQSPLDLGIQNEGVSFQIDLTSQVKNTAGARLSFSSPNLKNTAPWLTLNTNGRLAGRPARANVGKYTGVTIIVSSPGGSAQVNAYGEVKKVANPPKWITNALYLPDAFEDAAYTKNLASFVLNPDHFPLKYELVVGPPWLQVAPTGSIFGTPKKEDLGAVKATVRFTATDGSPYSAPIPIQLKVNHVNHAPHWTSNPLQLPDSYTKILMDQDLAQSVVDPDDNEKFTFQIVSGPSWATLSASGHLVGTPQKNNLGNNSWQIKVIDSGGLTDETVVNTTVLKSNEPPQWLKKPTLLAPAKEDFPYHQDLAAFAMDPDNDPLIFALVQGPPWLALTADGTLSGTPKAENIGLNKLTVQVSDNKSGTDVAELWIDVAHTNHSPVWALNPVRITAKEDQPLSVSVAPYAKDPDAGDKLTFTCTGGPTWATLSPDGTLTGTPKQSQVGDNTFTVQATDSGGLYATASVIISVQHVNHKPLWTKNPIVLPNAKERAAYSSSISSFATDPDPGDKLSFAKLSGPEWITVNPEGTVIGTPTRSNLGINLVTVRVTDPSNEFAVATLQISVEKVLLPPRWRQDPLLLSDAYENANYQFNLADYVAGDDGDTLTFKIVSGPSWMSVAASGLLTGVPKRSDVGVQNAVFEVVGSTGASDRKPAKIAVNKIPQAPIVTPQTIALSVKERATQNIALSKYVSNPSIGTTVAFSLSTPTDWSSLSSSGDLVLKPIHKNIGRFNLIFRVDNGEIPATLNLDVTVLRDPQTPLWATNPARAEAKTNLPISASLKDQASDPDDVPLTFSMQGNQSWLTVGSDGTLSGTPTDKNLGDHTFKVKACNDGRCSENQLIVTVRPGLTLDSTPVEAIVPGARTENLWIVDPSNTCRNLLPDLKKNIHYYYEALQSAKIQQSGIFLASDAKTWDGVPVAEEKGSWTLSGTDSSTTADFGRRVDLAYSWVSANCRDCYNSPFWSLFRFLGRVGTIGEIYHRGYFESGVPSEGLLITQEPDHYQAYSKNTAQKNWIPSDYAKAFLNFYAKENQLLRMSALTPTHDEADAELYTEPKNAYRVLVMKTHGVYYNPKSCYFDFKQILEDHAKRVIFRAYLYAKNRIKLSKIPKDISTLKVSVGGIEQSKNRWTYDPTRNEITLRWPLIDEGHLKEGNLIQIEYRTT